MRVVLGGASICAVAGSCGGCVGEDGPEFVPL